MAEYIEKDALLKSLKNHGAICDFGKHLIEIFPSADVAPVRHGRWLCVDTDTEQFFLCNRCKEKEYWESNYCPNCGCLMDGGADHADD